MENATIRDLTVEGSVIGSVNVGGVIGYASATSGEDTETGLVTISGVTSRIHTVSGTNYVGGILGYANGNVRFEGCTTEYIQGEQDDTEITESTEADAPVGVQGAAYLGGLAGYVTTAIANNVITFADCRNDVAVTGTGNYVGGLAGMCAGLTESRDTAPEYCFQNCENYGAVTGAQYIGGLAGSVGASAATTGCAVTCTGCINYGEIAATMVYSSTYTTSTYAYVGGLIGQVYGTYDTVGTVFKDCGNEGGITGGAHRVGGLAGYAHQSLTVESCYNTGNVQGAYAVGGLVGETVVSSSTAAYAEVSKSWNSGAVTGTIYNSSTTIYDSVGGLIGTLGSGSKIAESFNTGKITGASKYPGGLVGMIYGGSGTGYLASAMADCYNAGEVAGSSNSTYAAGLGTLYGGGDKFTLSNCFNYGQVTGKSGSGYSTIGKTTIGTSYLSKTYYLGADTDTLINGAPKSADTFRGGEVAYLLDTGENEVRRGLWGQGASYPVLLFADSAAPAVYQAAVELTTGHGTFTASADGIGVTLSEAGNGAVYAQAGQTVTMDAAAEDGYLLQILAVSNDRKTLFSASGSDSPLSFTMPSGNVTVRAAFAAQTDQAHTVTLDANGGYFGDAATASAQVTVAANGRLSDTAAYLDALDSLSHDPDADGNEMGLYYWVDADTGERFDEKTIVTEDTVLTAVWRMLGVEVTFDMNDTDGELTGLTKRYYDVGEGKQIPNPVELFTDVWSDYIKDGKLVYTVYIAGTGDIYRVYTLKGWALDKGGETPWDFSGTVSLDDDYVSEDAEMTLYAQWDVQETLLSGTEAAPYEIDHVNTLIKMSELSQKGEDFTGACFVLMEDIDLSDVENWRAIETFNGTLSGGDGRCKITLSDEIDSDSKILFHNLLEGAVIENLDLVADGTAISVAKSSSLGLLAIYNYGTVQDCSVSLSGLSYTTSAGSNTGSKMGGIVYQNMPDALIQDCAVNFGTTDFGETPVWFLGGLTYMNSGTMEGCSATGSVKGEKIYYFGGLSSFANDGEIIGCDNYADISTSGGSQIGGLVGVMREGTLVIQNSHNHGTISGKDIGGLIGYMSYGSGNWNVDLQITDCMNEGMLSGTGFIGGIIGYSGSAANTDEAGIQMTNVRNEGDLSGEDAYIGGLLGDVVENRSVSFANCYNTGKITLVATSTDNYIYAAGGILGRQGNKDYGSSGTSGYPMQFDTCTNEGDIYATGEAVRVGGIFGNTTAAGQAVNCTNSGNIYLSNGDNGNTRNSTVAGGIGAYINGGSSILFTISGCTNTGNIVPADEGSAFYSAQCIGGLVGQTAVGTSISDSDNYGEIQMNLGGDCRIVAAEDAVGVGYGGLVGYHMGTIENSHSNAPAINITSADDVTEKASLRNLGTLVGCNAKGEVSGCTATGGITLSGPYQKLENIGGLVGQNLSGTRTVEGIKVDGGVISKASVTGGIEASGITEGVVENAGGLVGSNSGTLSNSYVLGAFSLTGSGAGLLAGSNEGTLEYSYFYADSEDEALQDISGIASTAGNSTVTKAYYGAVGWTGNIQAQDGDDAGTWKSEKAFQQGEVAYLLDGGSGTRQSVWTQDEENGYPVFGEPAYYALCVVDTAAEGAENGTATLKYEYQNGQYRSAATGGSYLYAPKGGHIDVSGDGWDTETYDYYLSTATLNGKDVMDGFTVTGDGTVYVTFAGDQKTTEDETQTSVASRAVGNSTPAKAAEVIVNTPVSNGEGDGLGDQLGDGPGDGTGTGEPSDTEGQGGEGTETTTSQNYSVGGDPAVDVPTTIVIAPQAATTEIAEGGVVPEGGSSQPEEPDILLDVPEPEPEEPVDEMQEPPAVMEVVNNNAITQNPALMAVLVGVILVILAVSIFFSARRKARK